MAEAEYDDVRVEESLRVKIGEAKNLPSSSFSGSGRNTCVAIKIDAEEIYRTNTVEKSLNPFFGAEFQGEIPKKFRFLSFYLYEVGSKTSKVIGKVSLKKEELYKYHQKDHWFPLTYKDGDTEVQGKVQVEIKMEEFLTASSETSHRLAVRVIECSDLTVVNGSCNPYAVVALLNGKSKNKDVKKTAVRKKTICPQYDETFFFNIDKGQNQDKSSYSVDDSLPEELSVSLFHDDSKVSREVLGYMFKGSFLGEVKIPLSFDDMSRPHRAWYCLQAKEQNRTSDQSLGSIRLKISYSEDYVFPSKYYDGLRNLILQSADTKPVTASAAFILGEIVTVKECAAQPLVKLFLHHGRLVPLVHALADWEMSTTIDPNTLFRGNSLLTKMVDELMKLLGLPYLHDTLKSFIDKVLSESKPCEIDPKRLKESDDAQANLNNLYEYVKEAFDKIVNSGLVCPSGMRDVFSTLKSRAMLNYPDNAAVRYHAVTSFVFLRFFTAAILGPGLFELHTETPDASVQRTLTLISKGISGLVNYISSKKNSFIMKEEYMAQLYAMFPKTFQSDVRMFIDIISSSSGPHFRGIEAPIVIKEAFMIKRAQGRKKFGLKNFKKRFFRLTNQALSYSKNKGDKQPLFEIPITEILAVERLEEDSFKLKYMFQVVHAKSALYIQANNCVEEKEWLDLLMNICKSNKNRHKLYHPAAFVQNHWLCCKSADHSTLGCTPVTDGLQLTDIQPDIDSDREVEKIHSLFLAEIDQLDQLQGYVNAEDIEYDEICGRQAVYAGDLVTKPQGLGSNIDDPSQSFSTIAEIQKCIITLEQEHIQYMRSVQRKTVIGSIDTPIGDESSADLVRNMNRSSERLSRHGSRSSNASNISRRSFRGTRSRGGSFRERDRAKTESEGVRKSLSGDVSASGRTLGVDFISEVKKAASCDVMAVESKPRRSASRTISASSAKDHVDHASSDYTSCNGSNLIEAAASKLEELASATGSHNPGMLGVAAGRAPKTSTGFVPTGQLDAKRSSGHSSDAGQLTADDSVASSQSFNGGAVFSVDLNSSNSSGSALETSLDKVNTETTACDITNNHQNTQIPDTTHDPTVISNSGHLIKNLNLKCHNYAENLNPDVADNVKKPELALPSCPHHNELRSPSRPRGFSEPLQTLLPFKPSNRMLMASCSMDASSVKEQQPYKRQLSHPTGRVAVTDSLGTGSPPPGADVDIKQRHTTEQLNNGSIHDVDHIDQVQTPGLQKKEEEVHNIGCILPTLTLQPDILAEPAVIIDDGTSSSPPVDVTAVTIQLSSSPTE
ncbi:ras GTPase-activating protein 3-like [Physella acuta]|uniref:ras GTPase-activating protein 3-like n=1 Tax=Physella acuta TaxID=109671 RepID=UPI0027DC9417|nr:ras GTPase-activating protein 3-like [Physella acuta]